MADADLPPVPDVSDEADKKSEPDEDMGNQDDSDYCGPNEKTSTKILAQYSSKATRAFVRQKGSASQPAGKGSGKQGAHKGPACTGGKGPTPSEAHGPKQPGLQPEAGGEGGGGTATPARREDSPPAAHDEPPRNRWGDGPPLS